MSVQYLLALITVKNIVMRKIQIRINNKYWINIFGCFY